jgi:CheY-like chemotaxis protein
MDIQMPDLTGLQLIQNCKRENQYYFLLLIAILCKAMKLMRLIIFKPFEFER